MKIELKGGQNRMKQKYLLGILALAMISVLGIGAVSAYGFGNGILNPDLSDEDRIDLQTQMDSLHEAIADGDYDSWAEIMQNRIAKMQEEINEETFDSIVERYNEMDQAQQLREQLREAIQDQDNETAEELRTQLRELMPEESSSEFMNHRFMDEGRHGRGMMPDYPMN